MALKVLFCSSEVAPYAKTGGLADVAGALPEVLAAQGCDVRIFMPYHRSARDRAPDPQPVAEWTSIPIGLHDFHVHFWETRTEAEVPLFLLEKEEFFDRSHLYGHPVRGDYEDNVERFVAFCRAVHPLCIHTGWYPDVLHLNDWQSALTAAYLHFFWRHDPYWFRTRSVLTIHNLGYQGLFPDRFFSLTQLPGDAFTMEGMEFWGQMNFLKAGIQYSHRITTVSPQYSLEIQEPENGFGLDGVLRHRSAHLTGILNGIDTTIWNPETDPHLPANYSAENPSGKRRCKEVLTKECGFSEDRLGYPLFGMISRLTPQKGFDLLKDCFDDLLSLPLNLVILGTGDAAIEEWLKEKAERYSDRFHLRLAFDEGLAHRIEAGADCFLMPSRYEPCGLNQMYSLRYGTIPIVHAVGGLVDSVIDVLRFPQTGTGFKFYRYTPEAFLTVVRSALELMQDDTAWSRLLKQAMLQDFSWSRSARAYLEVYESALAESR